MGPSQFVDDAAEESGDEGAHTTQEEGCDEAEGYLEDGFVVGSAQADDDGDTAADEAAAAAWAEEKALDECVDRAELEAEMRELARDHEIEIAQRRKRLRGRAEVTDQSEEPLDDGIAEEAAALVQVEEQRRQEQLDKHHGAAASASGPSFVGGVSVQRQSAQPTRSAHTRGTKFGALWDKRHDMKATERPAKKKKLGKAKAVDLF